MNSDTRKEVIALGQTYFFTIQFVSAKYSKPLKIKRLGQMDFSRFAGNFTHVAKMMHLFSSKSGQKAKITKRAQTLETTEFKPFLSSETWGNRTPDTLIKSQVLYQLS